MYTLLLSEGDVAEHVATLPSASVDAILHDPPRFKRLGNAEFVAELNGDGVLAVKT